METHPAMAQFRTSFGATARKAMNQRVGLLRYEPSILQNLQSSTPAEATTALLAKAGLNNVGAAFLRDTVPWKGIADWTHSLAKTPTCQWMDAFKGGPFHRWQNHHPVDFFRQWLKDPTDTLKVGHYLRHVGLDVITTNGVPLLPQAVHETLIKLGIPFKHLTHLTHLNIFDLAVGTVSAVDGALSVFLAVTGHNPVGSPETILLTFGQGLLEAFGGIYSGNILLVAGGAMHISSASLAAWQHFHVADPTLLSDILPVFLPSAIVGGSVSLLRLGLSTGLPTAEKGRIVGETMMLSLTAAALNSIAPLLASPALVSYNMGRLAWKLAESDSTLWRRASFSSDTSFRLAMAELASSTNGTQKIQQLITFLTSEESQALSSGPELSHQGEWCSPVEQGCFRPKSTWMAPSAEWSTPRHI